MKKILLVNDFSGLAAGYSVYGKEVASRLYNTKKYEICELASFIGNNDPRIFDVPWKVIPVLPNPGEEEEYNSQINNKFGAWKFEETCIKFKPDIVWSFRDWWYDSFIETSPFKRIYHWVHMPTVDAYPLDDQWIGTYKNVDSLFAYTDFGRKVLSEYGLNCIGTASPAADAIFTETIDKVKLRQSLGIPETALVVGMVGRNQRRKLFPDLIESFKMFLEQAPAELSSRAILYLHTGYPDQQSWNIPFLLKEAGVSHKTLFTYSCNNCGAAYPNHYCDPIMHCKACGKKSAKLTDSGKGVNRTNLRNIYNLMDLYVQYATCLKPGTLINTENGWKSIETICVGEKVLTHNGNWKPVLKTFENPNYGAIDIKVWGLPYSLTITPEHPMYAIVDDKDVSRTLRERLGDLCRNKKTLPTPVFIEAGKLSTGDMLALKIDTEILNKDVVDLAEYAKNCDLVNDEEIKIKYGKKHKRFLKIDEKMCKFLGLYVAEGSATNNGVICITTHENEIELRNFLDTVFSFTHKKYKNRKAFSSLSYGVLLQRWLLNTCKKKENKQFPNWVMKLSPYLQLQALHGWLLGDGCFCKEKKVTIASTISKKLASQIECILQRNKIYYNLRITNKKGKRKPQYSFELRGNAKNGIFNYSRSSTNNLYYDDFYLVKIKSINKSNYTGPVYNIEVQDDNSYTTVLSTVHNCEGLGMPQVEAAMCGTPIASVDYSGMEDVVRKLCGRPIKVQRFYREIESNRMLALPDNQDLVNYMIEFFSKPKPVRNYIGFKTKNAALNTYSYDKTAQILSNCFDSVANADWSIPPRLHSPAKQPPSNLNNLDFVRWCISNVCGRPDLMNSYMALRLYKDLNYEHTYGNISYNDMSAIDLHLMKERFVYNREMLIAQLTEMCEKHNLWEQARVNQN